MNRVIKVMLSCHKKDIDLVRAAIARLISAERAGHPSTVISAIQYQVETYLADAAENIDFCLDLPSTTRRRNAIRRIASNRMIRLGRAVTGARLP